MFSSFSQRPLVSLYFFLDFQHPIGFLCLFLLILIRFQHRLLHASDSCSAHSCSAAWASGLSFPHFHLAVLTGGGPPDPQNHYLFAFLPSQQGRSLIVLSIGAESPG